MNVSSIVEFKQPENAELHPTYQRQGIWTEQSKWYSEWTLSRVFERQ